MFTLQICILPCFAQNPVVQTCYTADPAPMVHGDVVYLYVGHDSSAASNSSYLMRYYKCYSSKDMVNWTDHGIVLPTKSISWSGGEANAAHVASRNNRFYYYTSTNASGGIAIGVAVADSPVGPFTDIGKPLVTAGQMSGCNATHSWRGLDPAVLIDDDGQAYLYWGNNVLYWVKLNSDMISTNGTISCLDAKNAAFGPDFEEAPWVYKRNDIYYLVYASGFPECIRYSTSTSPTGPWTYKGQIMTTQPNGVSNTIHPGVIDFGGNSYFFYHNAGLPGGGSYRRSVCIEQFEYNADGTIPLIRETAAGVVDGICNFDPYDTIQAETICWESGVETKPCGEGGLMVTSISDGDYIKVKGADFGQGASEFEVRAASGSSGGTVELRLGSQSGTLAGTCNIGGTGGWSTWQTFLCDINNCTGIKDLFLVFKGSAEPYRLNWYRFTGKPVSGHTLSIEKSGQGNVSRSPDSSNYEEGASVTLTATPESGWIFNSWSGTGVNGSENPLVITMDADKTITAIFTRDPTETFFSETKKKLSKVENVTCRGNLLQINFTAALKTPAVLKLYNLNGGLVKTAEINTGSQGGFRQHAVDLTGISNGLYLVMVTAGRNVLHASEVILNK